MQAPLLDVDPYARRGFDFYETPTWMTRALVKRVRPFDVLEPCAGNGAISDVFGELGTLTLTNDLDPSRVTQLHLDATQSAAWEAFSHYKFAWTVSNFPFDVADKIVPLAVECSPFGVATILRLSWLEPTAGRALFLATHPPTRLIVLPRHDWRGTGSTDSVTSAWFIWDKNRVAKAGIDIVTKDERDDLIAQESR